MSLAHMNGARPLVLVELRGVRLPWWRDPERVLRVVGTLGIGLAGLVLGYMALGRPIPGALLAATWGGAALALCAAIARPCPRCGRWTRHLLTCPRWRP